MESQSISQTSFFYFGVNENSNVSMCLFQINQVRAELEKVKSHLELLVTIAWTLPKIYTTLLQQVNEYFGY